MTFSLKDFSGGLNNRSEILAPSQASALMNMAFANDTVLEKRKGSMAYDDFVATEPIIYIDEFRPYKKDDELLRATKTKLYSGSTEIATLHDGIQGVNYNGKYAFVDGEKIRFYGEFPFGDTTYEKVIGTPTQDMVIMELVNPPLDYTPLDNTHQRGVAKYDYTKKEFWYEPCVLELEDTYQGANMLPTNCKYIASHQGRLFLSGSRKPANALPGEHDDDDNVFISDIQNPYYFPVYLPIQLPPNSDKVTGLMVYDDSVVIGRKNDIYVITGMTNRADMGVEVFALRRINSHTGIANQSLMCVVHNYLFFFGTDGMAYALSSTRQDEKVISTSMLTDHVDITSDPINLTIEDLQEGSSAFHDNKWYVTVKDKVLVYKYINRAWTVYNNLNARSFYNKNDLLIWGDDKGRTSKESEDFLDYGVPYVCYWTGRWFDMEDANANKQFREFYLVAHTYNDVSSDVRLTFEIDYVDVNDEIVIENEIAIWGKTTFGKRFITRNINQSLPFVIGRRGRAIKFTFSNGYNQNVPVTHRYELDSYPNRRENTIVHITEENAYVLYKNRQWEDIPIEKLNQGMKVYQINGDYEYRGKR